MSSKDDAFGGTREVTLWLPRERDSQESVEGSTWPIDRRRALDHWMTAGGRLVVTASAPRAGLTAAAEADDDLVADYGIRLRVAETDWLAAEVPRTCQPR